MLKVLDIAPAVAALEGELKVSFATDEGARFNHRDRLFPLIEKACATRELAMLGPAFDAEGVTWAPYQGLHQAVTEDARLFTNNPIFETIANPSGLTYPASGPAATLADAPRKSVVRAPQLGEHTDEILASVLGFSDGQIARLHDAGVVAGPEKAR
jgi:2-methylfumaryl-CoA isomerase